MTAAHRLCLGLLARLDGETGSEKCQPWSLVGKPITRLAYRGQLQYTSLTYTSVTYI